MSARLLIPHKVRRTSVVIVHTMPWISLLILVVSDMAMLTLSAWIGLRIRAILPGGTLLVEQIYAGLWPLLIFFLPLFAAMRLYAMPLLNSVDELKRSVAGVTIGFFLVAATAFIAKGGPDYSRGAYMIGWCLAVVSVPGMRMLVRAILSRRSWWGFPVVILGAGNTGQAVVRCLLKGQSMGLRPVVMLDDDPNKHGQEIHGIPVVGNLSMAPMLAQKLGIRHAILAMPGASTERMQTLERENQRVFPHLLLVPNLCSFASLWVTATDLGGILGLEVQRNLLLYWPRVIKRAVDLLLCTVGMIPFLLLVGFIAIAIKCDGGGPIFYAQERIGRNGRRFKALKFRSMVLDADARLREYLEEHPELRAEWERDHKLRADPRVTRVGWLLRKTSLDELPQVFNVLAGHMSLVGPRPIVQAEVRKYDDVFELYTQVRPGITGLWQVSGRNDTTYAERVALDAYYVRNWSIWLDLIILVRTVRVVLMIKGAY